MENLPLHRKYRPDSFDLFIGNEALLVSLQSILEKDVTSILFAGPSGCGKTSLARIVAKELGARDKDIKELDISDTRGIEAARSIKENARYKAFGGKVKVYILDEVHKSTNEFQNAMLKTLEEPPKDTYFILCTTEPDKLLKTIRTRCTRFQVRSLDLIEIKQLLRYVLREEGRRKFPSEAIDEIAYACEGIPREALKTLDAVIDIKDDEKLIEAIQDFSGESAEVVELFNALLKKTKWAKMAKILKNLDEDPERIRYAVLSRMTNLLLSGKQSDRAFLVLEEFKGTFIYTKKAGLVGACYTICNM